jgi:putative PEP-CTERM system histidine kinase
MTSFSAYLAYTAVLLSIGVAVTVFIRDRRSLASCAFAAGMAVLAMEAVLRGLSLQAQIYADVLRWQHLRLMVSSLLPGLWLLFSLSFGRVHASTFLLTWRWVLCGAFVFPLGLVAWRDRLLFSSEPPGDLFSSWVLGLGEAGFAFYAFFLLSAVLILMNLERTLRASTGSIRWQLKFMLLGVGGLFAVRIYTTSQALLFSSLTSALEVFNAGALVIASCLVSLSLVRSRLAPVKVYLSQPLLYHSLTALIVGVYLLVVGVLAEVTTYLGGGNDLPLAAFVVFLALLGLAILLLSDELRLRLRRFISHNFRRPRYDYRMQWTTFTQQTASLLDRQALAQAVVKMVSETFGVAGVSLWLVNEETHEQLTLAGSTVFSEMGAKTLQITGTAAVDFVHFLQPHLRPIDCTEDESSSLAAFTLAHPGALREARMRYCVSLVAGGKFLGVMTLDRRITQEPFSLEDLDLLKTIADQTASSLLHLALSQQLVKVKEMEAFQTLSTFFVHDLKNLASMLSLTLANLPVHYDNPAFREDALRMIANSVDKINILCGRLSLLTKTLELQRTEVDLPALVVSTLAGLNGAVQATLIHELLPVPRLSLDPEQIQKVLINLVLNANDAVGANGAIRITTAQHNGAVILSVSDDGCGMSPEFIKQSLFRPFQTTKSKGLGIGLFQCKKIVEAHQGRIEVESEEGRGSTFRVVLPVGEGRV